MSAGIAAGEIRRLLIVDDDVAILRHSRRQLEREGRDVHTAEDKDAAALALAAYAFDVVIVDLWLRKRPSTDLIARVRSLQRHARIVVWTGYISVDVSLLSSLGVEMIITKPVAVGEVLARLKGGVPTGIPSQTTPTLERAKTEHVFRVLGDTDGNVSEAARRLGITRQGLQRLLREARRRPPDELEPS